MLSSIRAGLAEVPPGAAAVAVLPADHPFVPAEAVRALVARYRASRPLLVAPRFAGRRGHPLLIDRALFAEAAACDDAVGLRQLVERRAADLVELALDLPAETDDDLDTLDHLTRLRRR